MYIKNILEKENCFGAIETEKRQSTSQRESVVGVDVQTHSDTRGQWARTHSARHAHAHDDVDLHHTKTH